jgi:hypothetical protein
MLRRSLLIAAALMLVSAPAQSQLPTAPPQPDQIEEITNAELLQFAEAYLEIARIQQEFTIALDNAADGEAQQTVANEANAEMGAAVESSGLTSQRYDEIFVAMQADPALAAQVDAALQQTVIGTVTDDELARFANAFQQITVIQQEFGAASQAAQDETARAELEADANTQISDILNENRINTLLYSTIIFAAQSDQEFAQRVGSFTQPADQAAP